MRRNSKTYYFLKNMEGDVLALLEKESGNVVARYTYDDWGKCTNVENLSGYTVGDFNPFRYRSYYFDQKSGLYYVGSRYYDPEIGRFISPDEVSYLGINGTFASYNLYTYCLNNPINRIDGDGNWSKWATAGLIGGAVLCAAAITVLTCGVGTATLAGAVAVGAAKGTLKGEEYMQITRNLLLEQINDILDEAEKEVKRNHSSNSQWGEKELQYVVIPEMKELKQYAVKGTVYFKYGERQKMLESTYLIIDSLNALDSTSLGKKILLLQHTLNTTR